MNEAWVKFVLPAFSLVHYFVVSFTSLWNFCSILERPHAVLLCWYVHRVSSSVHLLIYRCFDSDFFRCALWPLYAALSISMSVSRSIARSVTLERIIAVNVWNDLKTLLALYSSSYSALVSSGRAWDRFYRAQGRSRLVLFLFFISFSVVSRNFDRWRLFFDSQNLIGHVLKRRKLHARSGFMCYAHL